LVQIWKHGALEEAKEPEAQQRTMVISKLTEGLGLTAAGIRVFEDINWDGQRAAATGQGICDEILRGKKMSLSCQTSWLCFCNTSPVARASPPVLLDIGDDDPDDPPAVQDEAPPALSFTVNCMFCKLFCKFVSTVNIYFSLSKQNVWKLQILTFVYDLMFF